jgi:hypothetical protein
MYAMVGHALNPNRDVKPGCRLPRSCATEGLRPTAVPIAHSMTPPSPLVTVKRDDQTYPTADEITTRNGRPLAPKQARHTSQMDWLRLRHPLRGEELARWQRLQGLY